jgi:amphi-Trp domain-containing protein
LVRTTTRRKQTVEFVEELERTQAAALLRQIAQALEGGDAENIQIDNLNIPLSPQMEILLEYEHDEGEVELELEFKWSALEKKRRPGKFELFRATSDQWYFRLKAPNGEIILSSEGYASKQGAMTGIESVKKNAQLENIEHRTSKTGQPYFVLKAANNQVIGTSQMYKRQSSCTKGAQSVINYASNAKIIEE